MPDLTLERHFEADPDTMFAYLSETRNLVKWWGPEGMTVPEHDLSLGRLGPWHSVMVSGEGKRYKVSGHVTHVDPPHSIGFTWAWHDENDVRGVESHVTFRLVPAQGGGTVFRLHHADLPEGEAAKSHESGWTSTLKKLERILEDATQGV